MTWLPTSPSRRPHPLPHLPSPTSCSRGEIGSWAEHDGDAVVPIVEVSLRFKHKVALIRVHTDQDGWVGCGGGWGGSGWHMGAHASADGLAACVHGCSAGGAGQCRPQPPCSLNGGACHLSHHLRPPHPAAPTHPAASASSRCWTPTLLASLKRVDWMAVTKLALPASLIHASGRLLSFFGAHQDSAGGPADPFSLPSKKHILSCTLIRSLASGDYGRPIPGARAHGQPAGNAAPHVLKRCGAHQRQAAADRSCGCHSRLLHCSRSRPRCRLRHRSTHPAPPPSLPQACPSSPCGSWFSAPCASGAQPVMWKPLNRGLGAPAQPRPGPRSGSTKRCCFIHPLPRWLVGNAWCGNQELRWAATHPPCHPHPLLPPTTPAAAARSAARPITTVTLWCRCGVQLRSKHKSAWTEKQGGALCWQRRTAASALAHALASMVRQQTCSPAIMSLHPLLSPCHVVYRHASTAERAADQTPSRCKTCGASRGQRVSEEGWAGAYMLPLWVAWSGGSEKRLGWAMGKQAYIIVSASKASVRNMHVPSEGRGVTS